MKIILDSTALRRDYFLSSSDARLLELYLKRTHSSVVVPKVVLDEVENLYREDLHEVNAFTAGEPGAYYYWASAGGDTLDGRRPYKEDSQLNGASIVDPPDGCTARSCICHSPSRTSRLTSLS
jgi:hypothetical protein